MLPLYNTRPGGFEIQPELPALRRRLGEHADDGAAARGHTPDEPGPHPRGTGADDSGFRLNQLRVAHRLAALARPLLHDGPDAAGASKGGKECPKN